MTTKTMMHRYLPSKLRFGAGVAVLMCLTLAAALSLEGSPAGAQSGSGYVDLVVDHYYGASQVRHGHVGFVVHNQGTAEARGVTVSFLLNKLQFHSYVNIDSDSVATPPPWLTDFKKEGETQSFTWDVGTIPAGSSTALDEDGAHNSFEVTRHSNTPQPTPTSPYFIGSIRAEASSQTFEPSALKNNNVRTVYQFHKGGITYHMDSRLPLYLSVDNLRPTSSSPDVDFGLTARAESRPRLDTLRRADAGVVADIEISVELSDGLQFKANWAPAGITKLSSRSATWNPEPVATDTTSTGFAVSRKIDIETALTEDSLQAIPLSERCITARVADSIPPPEPGYFLGSLKQCLGDDAPVLFTKGSIGILSPFSCIGVVNHICQDQDNDNTSDSSVVVAAIVPLYDETVNLGTPPEQIHSTLRSGGIGRNVEGAASQESRKKHAWLLPEDVLIQVKDPDGRVNDTYSHSLTSSGPTWQTGRRTTGRTDESGAANRLVNGVLVTYTKREFNDHLSDWTSMDRKLSVTYKNGDPVNGGIKMRVNSTGKDFLTTNP